MAIQAAFSNSKRTVFLGTPQAEDTWLYISWHRLPFTKTVGKTKKFNGQISQ